MPLPSDKELAAQIRALIPKVDLETTGIKAFTQLLSEEFDGVNLKSKTKFIKTELSKAINELSSDHEAEEEAPPAKKKRGAGKGLSVKKELSPKLAKLLGHDELSRTEIVQHLWGYIKANNLQNPENKREITLDANMKEVFGCDSFTMFTMNKYVAAHVHPFKPLDLTPKPKSDKPKKRKAAPTEANKKKRKPKQPGLQPPYRLSLILQAVVGAEILPRPQVVTALWDYIKKNELQDPTDKRSIICDAKLQAVMGGEAKVTMFTMNRFISPHLIEKVDKSLYEYEE